MKRLILLISIICLTQVSFGQVFGNAISLDGVDDFGLVPHDESLDPYDGSWSMICWVKAADKDQVSPIVMKRDPESPWTQYSYGFGKDDPHEPQAGKRIHVNHIEAAGAFERSGRSTDEVIDGDWHHIAVIADKAHDGIIIYADGSPLYFFSMYYFGAWPDVHTSYQLIVAAGSAGDKLEGLLDELSLWNKALGQDEILLFMNNPIPEAYYVTADSGVVAYYSFEVFEDLGIGSGGASDIRDLSSYGNHMGTFGLPTLVPSVSFAGVDEGYLEELAFEVYPNPCEDKVCIRYQKSDSRNQKSELRNLKFEILDICGNVLKTISFDNRSPGEQELVIDVSDLPAGMYFVRMEAEGKLGMRKLIVK